MYIYNFLNAISLLKKGNCPTSPNKTTEKTKIYFGYGNADTIRQSVPSIPHGLHGVLVYASLPDMQIKWTDIQPDLDFIEQLNAVEIDKRFYQLEDKTADAVLFEAIWALEALLDLPPDVSFLTEFEGGILELFALHNGNKFDDNVPVMSNFSSPLAKDMFHASCIYVIKNYCNARLDSFDPKEFVKTKPDCAPARFIERLEKQLAHYNAKPPFENWNVLSQTGVNNGEFDLFTQQLYEFSKDMSQKTTEEDSPLPQ